MSLKVSYDLKNKKIITTEDVYSHNEDEYNILKSIIDKLSNKFNQLDFNIVSNTNDYLTLQYKKFDIARIKYTTKSKWISVLLDNNDRNSNINNSLFELENNKNKMHWKSKLEDKNIEIYIPFLINSLNNIINK